ncbi:MAG: TonB-dependent receptor [Brumimicrobium sp.]|nr:TonB-dependent receptor [Brumimicrobium sp.]
MLFVFLMPVICLAQKGTLKGVITDHISGEPIIGAYVYISDDYRAKAEMDGSYEINNIPYGEYQVRVSMFSYDTIYTTVNINQPVVTENFRVGDTQEMEEVEVIGQLATDRKTPVAVSRISAKQIAEELGSQELPMILNSTPGVHATQQGGGDGDARISIRGFDQRNVGVMIDGVPVNDMENGSVYWSNWFGLDQITSQIQVQRGLGATKLAMPSVGGTMNIITESAAGNREIKVNQEYGTGNFFRTSLSYKSGRMKNGWGILFSGSYKEGDGWVDGLFTRGAFYYLKIQKKTGNHLTSLSAFGAPQEHAQRSFQQPIEFWDADYARDLGITIPANALYVDMGLQHNPHFGYFTNSNGDREIRAERRNYYHKPQITLKDFWKVNNKLSWSNMLYVSIGRGGGERIRNYSALIRDEEGLIDWDAIERNNQIKTLFGNEYLATDPAYHPTLLKSTQVMTAAVNNHMWIGGISQFDYELNDYWKISGGLDYRYYRGEHYYELTDLLGGNYWVNSHDQNSFNDMKTEGDKVGWQPYHNYRDGLVQWAGGYGQAEYAKGRWSAFVNLSTVVNGYKGIDYHQKREVHLSDTTLFIGGEDVVQYDGEIYHPNSPELKYNQTEWKWIPGFTLKSGANFNITEKQNVFLNLGYLSRTPQYSNVIDNNTNEFFVEIVNENIMAGEIGYGFRSKKLSFNVNGYYTYWENKPFPFGVSIPDPMDPTEFIRANVNGMDALHMGAELDGVYNILKNLTVEAMISYGDWTWQSSEIIDVVGTTFEFDAKGVHVGDAAQSTYALSLRYAPVKNGYIKVVYTYFDRYYSNFDPFSLSTASGNGGRESWQIPSYGLLSGHAGYRVKFEKSNLMFRTNVFNALNTIYISDATNNRFGSGFDATSAGVFVGQGFRFNVSVGFEF